MIFVLITTAAYQILLNRSFAPLFRSLPVTLEDDAVLLDEAFQRAYDHQVDQDVDEASNRDAYSPTKLFRQEKPRGTHNKCQESQHSISDEIYKGFNHEIEVLAPWERMRLFAMLSA